MPRYEKHSCPSLSNARLFLPQEGPILTDVGKALLYLLMLAGENLILHLPEPQWSGQAGPSKFPGILADPRGPWKWRGAECLHVQSSQHPVLGSHEEHPDSCISSPGLHRAAERTDVCDGVFHHHVPRAAAWPHSCLPNMDHGIESPRPLKWVVGGPVLPSRKQRSPEGQQPP